MKECEDSVQLYLHYGLISLHHPQDTCQISPAVCSWALVSNSGGGGSSGLQWVHRHKVKRGETLVSQASTSLLWGEYSGLRSHSRRRGTSLPLEELSRLGNVHWCSSLRPTADACSGEEANRSRGRGWKEPASFWSSLTGYQNWWLVKKLVIEAGG